LFVEHVYWFDFNCVLEPSTAFGIKTLKFNCTLLNPFP
jgi:hypothetical protein